MQFSDEFEFKAPEVKFSFPGLASYQIFDYKTTFSDLDVHKRYLKRIVITFEKLLV